MPIDPNKRIQYRLRMRRGTRLLLKSYAELAEKSFEEALDEAILFGVAYLNQKNRMELSQWIDTIRLPKVQDVEKFVEA